MTHLSFISKIQGVHLVKEDYMNLGVSEEYAERNSKNLIFIKRESPASPVDQRFNSEILALLHGYNLTFQVGLVEFYEHPKYVDTHIHVGTVELDILAINVTTYEIEVLDHDHQMHVIWPVAANSSMFLDALYTFAAFIFFKVKNKKFIDKEAAMLTKEFCIEQAGGDKYRPFYDMLIRF